MDNTEFDAFLDNVTHIVANQWNKDGGEQLTIDQKYALNDLLTAFFGALRTE